MLPVIDSHNALVEKWTKREMQLNKLHEEIVARRESLLRSSGNYFHQQGNKSVSSSDNCVIRNERLLKDIQDTEQMLETDAHTPPSNKFLTLQNNYWSMIRSTQSLWESAVVEAGRDG